MDNETIMSHNESVINNSCNTTVEDDVYLKFLLEAKRINEIANCIFICICCPFIFAGNIMVVISVIKFSKLQTVINQFVTSLAIADFLVGFPTIPFYIVFFIDNHVNALKHICLLKFTFVLMSLPASILNLSIATVDRYIAVIYPLHYNSIMTMRRARIMIALVWFYTLTTSMMPIFGINTWTMEKGCNFWIILPKPFTLVVVPVVFSLCLPTSIFMYVRIMQEAINSKKRRLKYTSNVNTDNSKHQRELRRAKWMAFVFLLFVIFWLPFFTASLLRLTDLHPIIVEMIKQWALSISMSNSAINPILYCWIRPEFRQAYTVILGITRSELTKKYLGESISQITSSSVSNISSSCCRYPKIVSQSMQGCTNSNETLAVRRPSEEVAVALKSRN